ncbi:hypothetical protein ACHWQZ_G018781 [Mnemiopsis leidyi]
MDADQEEKAPDIEDYIASPNLLAKDGSCNACDKVVDIDCESIQCFKCKNRFHAINCSNEKLCVSATTSFKNHLLPAVNKVNAFAGRFGRFLFQCDFCITAQEKAVTLKTNDHISSLNKKFEDMKSSFSRELSEVKQLLTTSIQQTAPMNPVRNPWDDSQRCAKLRSMVVIKNDEHGSPINKAILETKCVQNKISIVNTMQLKKSKDTAVILNSKKDADALMKQLAQTSPQHSTSSVATKLPRITVVGLERNYSKSELKDMVSSQNSGIYTLVNSASDDEDKKIDVLAVVPLKNNPNLYKAIIRNFAEKFTEKILLLKKELSEEINEAISTKLSGITSKSELNSDVVDITPSYASKLGTNEVSCLPQVALPPQVPRLRQPSEISQVSQVTQCSSPEVLVLYPSNGPAANSSTMHA